MAFPVYPSNLPYVTTEQMIEVDRAMVQDYHIELIQMMENAGRNLAHLARIRFLDGNPQGKKVVVLAGTGGNGGGALVCARRLYTWGAKVQVVVTRPATDFTPVPAHQLDILQRMKVPIAEAETVSQVGSPGLIVDGLIGYRLTGAPRGAVSDLIRWANAQPAPILALDVPSGLDTTSGTAFDPAIQVAQAGELLGGPANTTLPVVLVCDCNSSATGTGLDVTPTYADLIQAGFIDAWSEAHPGEAGFTCCQNSALTQPSAFTERIDLVLFRGDLSHIPTAQQRIDAITAADILRGRKVAKGTRMLVFPASSRIFQEALDRGYVLDLMRAGAVVMNSGCGPCLGVHEGALGDGEVALSTTNRNFKGRMGNPNSEVYLCSPEVAAASALTGVITDPRKGA